MKINLGCGYEIRNGWVNVDYKNFHGIDIVHNLEELPYPFKDKSADNIFLGDILEHLNNFEGCLRECKRILKNSGTVEIVVPHFTNPQGYTLYHRMNGLHSEWFEQHFCDAKMCGSLESEKLFKLKSKRITFLKGLALWNYLVEPLVNLNNFTRRVYEFHFCGIFPAYQIIWKAKKHRSLCLTAKIKEEKMEIKTKVFEIRQTVERVVDEKKDTLIFEQNSRAII